MYCAFGFRDAGTRRPIDVTEETEQLTTEVRGATVAAGSSDSCAVASGPPHCCPHSREPLQGASEQTTLGSGAAVSAGAAAGTGSPGLWAFLPQPAPQGVQRHPGLPGGHVSPLACYQAGTRGPPWGRPPHAQDGPSVSRAQSKPLIIPRGGTACPGLSPGCWAAALWFPELPR